jgi:Carboxypeptidase regulatory-like domain
VGAEGLERSGEGMSTGRTRTGGLVTVLLCGSVVHADPPTLDPPRFPLAGPLHVHLVDSGGEAVPGAVVWAEWLVAVPDHYHGSPFFLSATTDAMGMALIEGLPATGILVTTEAQGSASTDPLRIDLYPGASAELTVSQVKGATIAGTVVTESGHPLGGAQVDISEAQGWTPDPRGRKPINKRCTTESDGRFQFTSLRPGRYLLEVNDSTEGRGTSIVKAGLTDQILRLRRASAQTGIRFEVHDALKKSLEHCEVRMDGWGALQIIEKGGLNVPIGPGLHEALGSCFTGRHEWFSWSSQVRVDHGGITRVTIERPEGWTLRGQVQNSRGQPLPLASIGLTRSGSLQSFRGPGDEFATQADVDGQFQVSGLLGEKYLLSPYYVNMRWPDVRPVGAADGQPILVVLKESPTIVGQVVDSSGNSVELFEIGDGVPSVFARGRFEHRLWQYSARRLTVTFWSEGVGARRLQLPDEERTDLGTVQLEPERPAVGKVIDAQTGLPIALALLEPTKDAYYPSTEGRSALDYWGGEDIPRSVRTNIDGLFLMTHSVPHIPVLVSMPGYATATLMLGPGVNVIRLQRSPVVEGVVRSGSVTCVRARGANSENWPAHVVTDELGNFRIWALEAGHLELRHGCGTETGPVVVLEVSNGTTSRIELP